MEPRELIIDSLAARGKKYRQQLNSLRSDFSEEAVHDMRVATRRLLALLDLLGSLDEDPRIRRLQRDFKAQLDKLDPLRDTQVMLVELGAHLEELPALVPFRDYLARREQELLVQTREWIAKISFSEVSRLTGGLQGLRSYVAGMAQLGDPLAAMDKAFAKATKRAEAVQATDPASFHRLRIAIKKLRYGVEIVYPLVKDFPKENLKAMDEYQTALGHVQDGLVILAALDEYAQADAAFDLAAVRPYYERRQGEAIEAYLPDKDRLAGFWRATPQQAFPWETSQ